MVKRSIKYDTQKHIEGQLERDTYNISTKISHMADRGNKLTERHTQYLDLFERNLKGKRFIIVGVERALLDRRLLLFYSLPIEHQGYFNIGVCSRQPPSAAG